MDFWLGRERGRGHVQGKGMAMAGEGRAMNGREGKDRFMGHGP